MARNLIKYLLEIDNDNEYILFFNYFKKEYRSSLKFDSVELYKLQIPRRLIKFIWSYCKVPIDSYFPKMDIFHSLHRLMPPTKKIKTLLNIHDCRFIAHPDLYSTKEVDSYRKQIEISLKHSDLIITISNFMKKEIQKYFGIDEEKIRVIYNGFDYKYPDKLKSSLQSQHFKFKTSRSYIIFLGPLDKRKNLNRLLMAYEKAIHNDKSFPDILIAGVDKYDFNKYLKINNLDINSFENKVIIAGFSTFKDIYLLISNAKALCYPSIYEGFGYPPLEAMACGVPVLTSNTSSIPEIVGDAALKVNPFSIEEICQGLEQIVHDKEFRESLIKMGYNQVRKFPWEKTALSYINAYNYLYKS